MPFISKPLLKTKFETGDIPTQSDFVDFIDSCYNEQQLDWVYQQFIPDNLINVSYSNGGVTGFGFNLNITKKMFVAVPVGAKKIKSIRLFGQGVGQITNIKVFYFTDFNFSNPLLNPVPSYPGTQYTFWDQNPGISVSSGFPLFDETISGINQDLDFITYRYFSIHLSILTPAFIWGGIYLKPFGIEYE